MSMTWPTSAPTPPSSSASAAQDVRWLDEDLEFGDLLERHPLRNVLLLSATHHPLDRLGPRERGRRAGTSRDGGAEFAGLRKHGIAQNCKCVVSDVRRSACWSLR